MKRLIIGLLAPILGVSASLVVSQPADADVGGSWVRNMGGSPVLIRGSYSSNSAATPNSGTLVEYDNYPWHSEDVLGIGNDVDQFRSVTDKRCISYRGPGYTDGWYKINANTWYKVSDLAHVDVRSFYYSDKCDGRPYFTHR